MVISWPLWLLLMLRVRCVCLVSSKRLVHLLDIIILNLEACSTVSPNLTFRISLCLCQWERNRLPLSAICFSASHLHVRIRFSSART
jgi:hypothetical protein